MYLIKGISFCEKGSFGKKGSFGDLSWIKSDYNSMYISMYNSKYYNYNCYNIFNIISLLRLRINHSYLKDSSPISCLNI